MGIAAGACVSSVSVECPESGGRESDDNAKQKETEEILELVYPASA